MEPVERDRRVRPEQPHQLHGRVFDGSVVPVADLEHTVVTHRHRDTGRDRLVPVVRLGDTQCLAGGVHLPQRVGAAVHRQVVALLGHHTRRRDRHEPPVGRDVDDDV